MGRFFLLLTLGQLMTCGFALPLPRLLRRQAPNNLSIPMQEIGSGPSRPNDPHFCCSLGADTNGVLQVYCQYDWYPIGQDWDGGGSGEDHSYDFDHPYHPKAEKWDIPQPVWLECNFARKHKRSKLEPRHKKTPDRDGDSDEWGMPEGGRDYAGRSTDPARTNVWGYPAPIGAHFRRLKRSLAAAANVVRAQLHDPSARHRPRPHPVGPHRAPEDNTTNTASVSSSYSSPLPEVVYLHKIHRRRDQPSTVTESPYHLAPVPPPNVTPYDLDPHHEQHHSSGEDSEDDTRPFPKPPDQPHRKHYPMNGGEMPEDAPIIRIGPGGPPPEVVRQDGKKVIFPWDTNADIPSLKHGPYDKMKRHEKLPPDPPGVTGDPLLIDEEDIPGLNEFEEEQLELLRHNSELSKMPAWGGEDNYERNDRRSLRRGNLAAGAAAGKINNEVDEHEAKEAAEAAARHALMAVATGSRIKARDVTEAPSSVVVVTATAAADGPGITSPPSEQITVLVVVSDLPAVGSTKTTAFSLSASSTRCASAKKSKEPEGPSFIHRFLTKWSVKMSKEMAEEADQHDWDIDWVAEHQPRPILRPATSSASIHSTATSYITTINATTTPAATNTIATTILTTTPSSFYFSSSASQPSAQATLRLAPRAPEYLYYYHRNNKYADEEPSTAIVTVTAPTVTNILSTSSTSSSSPPPPLTVVVSVTATAPNDTLPTSSSEPPASTVVVTATATNDTLPTSSSEPPASTVVVTATAPAAMATTTALAANGTNATLTLSVTGENETRWADTKEIDVAIAGLANFAAQGASKAVKLAMAVADDVF